ncbi:hypothetical protein DENSPDRAFT_406211 [Dentipellis sp. KUC8613]|nr:hypothetical protein DENSPDRAFT_406211 [Dentipellis sp. KUC8613]
MRPAEDGGRERRCAKIAGLLAQGVAGAALATAVRDWEVASGVKGGGRASEKASEKVDVKAAGGAAAARSGEEQVSGPRAGGARKGGDADVDLATGKARSASPVRFTVPLTAMFKRSLSAPLVDVAAAAATSPSPHHNDLHHNHKPARDRVTTGPGPFEMLPQPALSPAPSDASAPPAFGWPNASINTQSPPGSPFSVGTADTELCASPVDTPMPPPMVAQGYLSSYSSLYGWAGSGDAGSPLDADVVGPGPFAHGYSYGGAQKDFDFDLEFGSGAGYGYGLGYGLGYGYARDPAVYEGPDGCDYGGRDVGAGPYAFGAAQAPYGYGVPQGVGLLASRVAPHPPTWPPPPPSSPSHPSSSSSSVSVSLYHPSSTPDPDPHFAPEPIVRRSGNCSRESLVHWFACTHAHARGLRRANAPACQFVSVHCSCFWKWVWTWVFFDSSPSVAYTYTYTLYVHCYYLCSSFCCLLYEAPPDPLYVYVSDIYIH